MNHPMRRSRQALSREECEQILERNTSGVLALITPEGEPYPVPMSYAWADGVLYFHGAQQGRRMDAIRHCAQAGFCVIDQDVVAPEEYSTLYRSVIVTGKIRELTEPAQKEQGLLQLAAKYRPHAAVADHMQTIHRSLHETAVLMLTVEEITGKEAAALRKK